MGDSHTGVYIPPHRRVTRPHEDILKDHGPNKTEYYKYTQEMWAYLRPLVDRLGDTVIDAVRVIDGTCGTCKEPYYGRLDEGKMTIPIGLKWRIDPSYKKYLYGYDSSKGSMYSRFGRSAYEVRMEIVRSGIWSREQLRGARFTQHELEVNDRSYCRIRPRVCGCHYGEYSNYSDAELEILQIAGVVPVMTEVEAEFVRGGPVRTGFRLRSKKALEQRAAKKAAKKVVGTVNNTKVDPVGSVSRRNRQGTSRPRTPRQLARKARKPYFKEYIQGPYWYPQHWYFYRTRSCVYLSKHHPLKGQRAAYRSQLVPWDVSTYAIS